MGYSMMAETYYNFGWLGPFIVLPIIGLFIGWLLNWEQRSEFSLISIATVITFYAFVFGVRSDATSLFRMPIWTGFIPYYLTRMSMRLKQG